MIREARVGRQMTQAELAEVMGTKQQVVSEIETRGNLNLSTLEAVASAVDAELVLELRLRP